MIVERILAHRLAQETLNQNRCVAQVPRMASHAAAAKTPKIAALLIDVGGVLYDDTSWWRWLVQLVHHAGAQTRYDTLLLQWESEYLRHSARGELAFWESLRACLKRLGLTSACCDEVQAAATAQQKHWEATLHAFPGVESTLSELSQRGIRMIAVADSGCSGHQLTRRLRALSLASYFDQLVSADDGHDSLLEPTFYQQPFNQRRFECESAALVSSKPRHLSAAHQSGLKTIAVNCLGRFRADLCLGCFTALPCQLGIRGSRQAA
jgi:FMN phosphatase YigB (HAD superfamily)